MAMQTNLKVRIVDTNSNPKQGVVVAISNPPSNYIGAPSNLPAPAAIQTQTTDGGGYVLFTSLNADTYAIVVSGVSTLYTIKNTYAINPDTQSFQNKTFASSTSSGVGIWTQNQVVQVGTISGAIIAPNIVDDFTGGVRTAANTPSFYNPNTNTVILWSGTNVGRQFDNSYTHTIVEPTFVQSTTIKVKI